MTPEQLSRELEAWREGHQPTLLGELRHLNISGEAEVAFFEIWKRRAQLLAWGVEAKVPNVRAQLDELGAFINRWVNDPEIAELQAASEDLRVAELHARDVGFQAGQPEAGQVKVPDVVSGTVSASTAEKIDEGAKAVEGAVQKAADEIGDAPGSFWRSLPWQVKAGAGAAVLAVIVGAVRR